MFFALFLCVLNDEDGILSGKSDKHHKPDLDVDIVGVAAQRNCQKGAEDTDRYPEKDRKRDGPTLIKRRQAKKDEDDSEAQHDRLLRARFLLLERGAGPFGSGAGRKSLRGIVEGGDRLAGTVP